MTILSKPMGFAVLFSGWVVYSVLMTLYYPGGGDEPGYFNLATLMASGKLPIIDYTPLQPYASTVPFAFTIKYLSNSIEAARLVALTCSIVVTLLVWRIVYTRYGATLALVAFIMMALNHYWYVWNAHVIHYPITNVCLVASFYLIYMKRPGVLVLLAAGFLAGVATNSRFLVGPVTLTLLVLAVLVAKNHFGSYKEAALRSGLPFCIGGLAASLPTFALLYASPEKFFYAYGLARLDWEYTTRWSSDSIAGTAWNMISQRFSTLYAFFTLLNDSVKTSIGNLTLFIPFVLVAGFLALGGKPSTGWSRRFLTDPLVRGSGVMIIMVIVAHFATLVLIQNFQYLIPFALISGMAVMHYAFSFEPGHEEPRNISDRTRFVVLSAFMILLVPYIAFYSGYSLAQVVRRAEPSYARPITIKQAACWVEAKTSPDTMVISWSGLPVVLAGRELPSGFDYTNGSMQLYWGLDNETKLDEFGIYSMNDFVDDVQKGRMAYVIDDNSTNMRKIFPELWKFVLEHYIKVDSTGGHFPFDFYRHKSLPYQEPNEGSFRYLSSMQLNLAELRSGPISKSIGLFVGDIYESITLLPRDLKLSWAWMTSSSYDERCASIVTFDENGDSVVNQGISGPRPH